MYERLVDALRNMDVSDSCPCSVGNMCDDQDCIVYQAADAIGELEKSIPRWIPVTERLPEESEGLNWGEEPTLRFTSVWCCDVNTGTIEVRNRLQGKKTGIECLDEYTKDTKWHWSHSWWEPTHWMPIVPLPEKPKE